MTFDTAECLRRATGRAKSDVANKLISMFLHSVSRKICAEVGLYVSDAEYASAVAEAFGGNCCYCGRVLEKDRVAVEHPDGMNRFRVGLHIPGNVIISCKRCNGEKRRDDQLRQLVLGETGWESFLGHAAVSRHCTDGCKTCNYWGVVWPEGADRQTNLRKSAERIRAFRMNYSEFQRIQSKARESLRPTLENLYSQCQNFAERMIEAEVGKALSSLGICGGREVSN